jgi:hypothetical protein
MRRHTTFKSLISSRKKGVSKKRRITNNMRRHNSFVLFFFLKLRIQILLHPFLKGENCETETSYFNKTAMDFV